MQLLLNCMHISYEVSKANQFHEQGNSIGANMLALQCTSGILLDKLMSSVPHKHCTVTEKKEITMHFQLNK